jgi:LmbE family N-acetylglucosaminyl deacetylase
VDTKAGHDRTAAQTPRRSASRPLAGVVAHPDDDPVSIAGGTFALAAARWTPTIVVSLARGEREQLRRPTP